MKAEGPGLRPDTAPLFPLGRTVGPLPPLADPLPLPRCHVGAPLGAGARPRSRGADFERFERFAGRGIYYWVCKNLNLISNCPK